MTTERNRVFRDSFKATHSVERLNSNFDRCLASQDQVAVAGRMMLKRVMGKIIFFHIQSGDSVIQGYVNRIKSADAFQEIKANTRVGDIVGISGVVFLTGTQERTVNVESVALLSTAMRSLPDKFHGVTDQEVRYRQRYLDLVMTPETRDVFRKRFSFVRRVRDFLADEGFIEVETPIMQEIPGGAAARPFVTHHNALDVDLYLRISPETYLKRLIVGGFEKVFEIGKSFRNEGLDPSHLQEFTMLEFYLAYASYRDTMVLTKRLMQDVIGGTIGALQFIYQGTVLDFSGDWDSITFRDLLFQHTGIDVLAVDSAKELFDLIREKSINIDVAANASLGTLMDQLYKKVCRPKLTQPTIITGQPMVLLPLARPNDDNSQLADAFQVIVNGWEVVKAYSELADPVIQRRLLQEQAANRAAGDEEAMFVDENFLLALEHGMPPVSGVGIGIDRLLALMTNQCTLREVVLFPMMR